MQPLGEEQGQEADWRQLEAAMASFRRRAGLLSWAVHSVRFATAACLVWGLVVLVARGLWDLGPETLRWGWFVLPLAALLGGWRSRRHVLDDRALRALFDDRLKAGGLVMAAGELSPEELASAPAVKTDWRPRLEQRSMPRPRWHSAKDLSRLGLAGAFVLGAFLLPTDWQHVEAEQRLDLSQQAEALQTQLDTLQEEGWLDNEEAENLAAALDALQSEAEDPTEAFETLDHLEEQALWAAAQAAEAGLADGERLAVAEAVTDAVLGAELSGSEATGTQAANALNEVAGLLGQMAQDAPWMSPELAAELQASGASAAELQAALGRGRGELQEHLERLQQAGVLDGEALKQLEVGQQPSQDALEAFLDQHQMPASEGMCQGGREGDEMGRGGVRRGPGHAPLTVRDAALFDPEWAPQVLPASEVGGLGQSQLLGERRVEPQEGSNGAPNPSPGGLLDSDPNGGGAWTHTVLPRHRQAVRTYFDRDSSDRDSTDRDSTDRDSSDRRVEDRTNPDSPDEETP